MINTRYRFKGCTDTPENATSGPSNTTPKKKSVGEPFPPFPKKLPKKHEEHASKEHHTEEPKKHEEHTEASKEHEGHDEK